MMYVAVKELNTASGLVKPGEIVKDAPNWNESVRNAHVNMGWMKKVDDEGVEISKVSTPSVRKSVMTPDVKVNEVTAEGTPDKVVLLCTTCQKTGFKTERALKIHVTTAHRK